MPHITFPNGPTDSQLGADVVRNLYSILGLDPALVDQTLATAPTVIGQQIEANNWAQTTLNTTLNVPPPAEPFVLGIFSRMTFMVSLTQIGGMPPTQADINFAAAQRAEAAARVQATYNARLSQVCSDQWALWGFGPAPVIVPN
jgi:hypothetical protein